MLPEGGRDGARLGHSPPDVPRPGCPNGQHDKERKKRKQMVTKTEPKQEAKRVMVCKTGNLTRDPELRFSAKGTPWAQSTIAVNPWVRDAKGGHKGEAEYYDLRFFGSLAEHVAESLSKGDRIIVSGQGTVEEFTRKDGTAGKQKVILCNDAGAELRFATCTVDKATRTSPDDAETDDAYDPDGF